MRPRGESISVPSTRYVGHWSRHSPQCTHREYRSHVGFSCGEKFEWCVSVAVGAVLRRFPSRARRCSDRAPASPRACWRGWRVRPATDSPAPDTVRPTILRKRLRRALCRTSRRWIQVSASSRPTGPAYDRHPPAQSCRSQSIRAPRTHSPLQQRPPRHQRHGHVARAETCQSNGSATHSP